jgi:hypothetical protein
MPKMLVTAAIFKQTLRPWLENFIALPRDRLVRAAGYIIGLSILLFGLLRVQRTLWPWIRKLAPAFRAALGQVYQRIALRARRPMDLTPEALPPGTASAIAMATQPAPPAMRRSAVVLVPPSGSLVLG